MSYGADQPSQPPEPAGPCSSEPASPVCSGPFFQATDWLAFGITALVALVVYLCSLAPQTTLEFSGTLSTSAKYAGVAYPPGFPVWTFYSWIFVTVLPFSNIAWRVALGSAVAASLACGLVALIVSRTGTMLVEHTGPLCRNAREQNVIRTVCGFGAGMALGVSQAVWREAVLAEVWAFTLLLFGMMLCLFTRWMVGPELKRFLWGAFFVFGLLLTAVQQLVIIIPAVLLLAILGDEKLGRDLSLPVVSLVVAGWVGSLFGWVSWLNMYYYYSGEHAWLLLPFLFVGVVGLVAIVRTRGFGSEWRSATLCVVSLLLGLGCYFYLPIASMTNPPENWGYARTVEGFVHLITRGQYGRPHPVDQLGRFIGQLGMLAKQSYQGFGWPYLVFMVLPFWFLRHPGRFTRQWVLALVAIFICVGPLLVAVLNPGADRASVEFVAPYFAAMYFMLAIWTGLGLMVAVSLVAKRRDS